MDFLIKIFKYSLIALVLIIFLALSLNYVSPYYRYAVFQWISSQFADQIVVEKINDIKIEPQLLSNEITLKGLKIYSPQFGTQSIIQIDEIKAKINFLDLFKNQVLFEKIEINNINFDLQSALGFLLANDPSLIKQIYQNLITYFPKAKANFDLAALEQNSSQINFMQNQLIKKISREIEINNSKILLKPYQFDIQSAKIKFFNHYSQLKSQLIFDDSEVFDINLLIDNTHKNLGFEIKQFPLFKFSQSFDTYMMNLLNTDLTVNLKGNFNFETLELKVDQFELNNQQINLMGSIHYEQKNNRQLNIKASNTNAIAINYLKNFIPKQWMGDELAHWFSQAFDQGSIENLLFNFEASLNEINQYQFKKLFDLSIETKNTSFNFHPDWQKLNQVDSKIELTNFAIKINALIKDQGLKNTLVEAKIDSFYDDPRLDLMIKSKNKQQNIDHFIQNSPLAENLFLNQFKELDLQGQMQSLVNLILPLNDSDNYLLDGQLNLINNQLRVNPWFNFKNINAKVIFNKQTFTSDIDAKWLNNAIKLSMNNHNNQLAVDYGLDLNAKNTIDQFIEIGKIDQAEIAQLLKKSFNGQTQLTGKISANLAENNLEKFKQGLKNDELDLNLTVSMQSSLVGLDLNLTYPFIKKAQEISPILLNLSYQNNQLKIENFKFNEKVNLIHLKGTNPDLFDLSVVELDLNPDKLELLTHLEIMPKNLKQIAIPNINFTFYRLRNDDKEYGTLQGEMSFDQNNQIQINNLSLSVANLTLSGQLKTENNITSLVAKSTQEVDLDKYFDYFSINPITKEAKTELKINLNWPNQIWHFSLDKLWGDIEFKSSAGELLTSANQSLIPRLIKELTIDSVKTRLINIFSLEKIFEGIDPSTILKKNIQFNQIDGKIRLAENKLFTDKVKMRSKSVNIEIGGFSDLNTQSLDHYATLSPDLFAIFPMVGIFTGNIPLTVLGLISDRIIDKEKAFKIRYHITGNFKDPKYTITNLELLK